MTLPRELRLETRGTNFQLCARPVAELSNYLGEIVSPNNSGVLMEITAHVSIKERVSTKIRVSANSERFLDFGFDAATNSVFIDRSNAWCKIPSENIQRVAICGSEEVLDIRAVIDCSSIEIFAGNGAYVLTGLIFLPTSGRQIRVGSSMDRQPACSIEVRTLIPR